MLSESDVVTLLAPLVEMAPATDSVSAEMWRIWHVALRDLSAESVAHAVTVYLSSEQRDRWMPAPAAIRRLAVEFTHGRALSGDEAWGQVLEARKTWSQHDREAAKAAVAKVQPEVRQQFKALFGSLGNLQSASINDEARMRREFIQAWNSRAEQITRDHMRPEGYQARIADGGMLKQRAIPDAVERTAAAMRLPN